MNFHQNSWLYQMAVVLFWLLTAPAHSLPEMNPVLEVREHKTTGTFEIKTSLERSFLLCAKNVACPENVGLVLYLKQRPKLSPILSQCTGFLIQSDVVSTNQHCVSEPIPTGVECGKVLGIRLVDHDGKMRIFTCTEVISQIRNPERQDMVLFRIQETGVKPFKVMDRGLEDREPIRVAKVDPLSHGTGGYLKVVDCEVTMNSLLHPAFTNGFTPTGLVTGCQFVTGNSGGPVYLASSEGPLLAGMFSGSLNATALQSRLDVLGMEIDIPLFPANGIFTNLACINQPRVGILRKSSCREGASTLDWQERDAQLIPSEVERSLVRFGEGWANQLSPLFSYEFEIEANPLQMRARPICIHANEMQDRLKQRKSKEGLFLHVEAALLVELRPQMGLDSGYRLNPRVGLRIVKETIYSLELKQGIQGRWQGRASAQGISGPTAAKPPLPLVEGDVLELNIPDCSSLDN